MKFFNNIFISHRSFDFCKAERFRDFLLSNNICENVVLLKNETLCKNYEQLTIHEYYESIEKLRKEIEKCDGFFYIDCPNYTNGYYTSAELLQWRRINDHPIVYSIRESNGVFLHSEPIELQSLSAEHKMRLARVACMMEFDPEYGAALESWGKFASNCFLVGCSACGEYYLVSVNKMEHYIKSQELAKCPCCFRDHATFFQYKNGPKFFSNRFPIVMKSHIKKIADLKRLDVDDVIDLLDAKKLPERFKLVALPNEKLQSDLRKNLKSFVKTVATTAGIVGGLFAALSFLEDSDKKNYDKKSN